MTPDVRAVFAGLFAVLVIATALGQAIAWRRPSRTISNVNTRVFAWWVMIAVGGLALLLGRPAVILLFASLSWFAWREFAATDLLGPPSVWYFLAVPVQYVAIAFSWPWIALLMLPLSGFLLNRQRWLGLLLCVYGLSFIPALARPEWMLFLVLIVQASDVLQYLWGRAAGRHAIAPQISPSKTVEGFAGGILTATALGGALHHLTPFGPWGALGASLLATGAGFASGLVLSALKRQRRLKDWGSAIAGHGGVLDRVDSLCFSAPVFYGLVQLFAS